MSAPRPAVRSRRDANANANTIYEYTISLSRLAFYEFSYRYPHLPSLSYPRDVALTGSRREPRPRGPRGPTRRSTASGPFRIVSRLFSRASRGLLRVSASFVAQPSSIT